MAKDSITTANGGTFVSPLRYPGGKGRLGPWIASVLRANNLTGGCYVEPYAGGAGVALFLLLRNHVRRIVINDADPAVHAFWHAVVQEPETLIREINTRSPTMDTRAFAQDVLAHPEKHPLSERAFATFFLNRTSRSGILKGGVIGGKAQDGTYTLDARYNREDLVARIQAIAAQRHRIKVFGMDAVAFLDQHGSRFPKKTLVYLDPPYYIKGSQLYRNSYTHQDHVAVAEAARGLAHPTLITYDDVPEIRKIYKGMPSSFLSLHYSTHQGRPMACEAVFYDRMRLPTPPTMTRGERIIVPRSSRPKLRQQVACPPISKEA